MEGILAKLNIYLIPPMLFLATGFSLAIFSLAKGKRQRDTVTFALLSLWWSLLSIVFVSHHLFKGDTGLIMTIERVVHCAYVFIPFIGIQFFHAMTGYRNRAIVITSFTLSAMISLTTFSDQYIYGLWEYQWGYIAKGGIIFQLFGAYSFIVLIYGIVLFIKTMRAEADPVVRLKLRYLMISMFIIALLSQFNIPAMNGIDIYPMGNFAFLPMLLMAWGIYRHDVIQINRYAKRRLTGIAIRIIVVVGLVVMLAVAWWALSGTDFATLAQKTVPYGLPPLLSFLFCSFLSVMGLRVGANRRESFVFSFLTLGYTFLSLDIFINCVTDVPEIALRASRMSHVMVVLLPSLFVHLNRVITRRKSERPLPYVLYAVSALLVPFTQSDWYLSGVYSFSWGFFAKTGLLFNVVILLSTFSTIYSMGIIILAYRNTASAHSKQRLLFFLLGAMSGAIMSMGNFPAMNGIDIYPAGNFIFVPMTFFAIGLYRYNRDEMVLFASTAAYYLVLAACVAALSAAIARFNGSPLLHAAAVLALVAMIIFAGSWRRLSAKIFSGRKTGLNRTFERLGTVLSKCRSFDEIGRAVAAAAFEDLRAQRCTMLFFDGDSNVFTGLERAHGAPVIVDEAGTANAEAPLVIDADHPLLALYAQRRPVFRQEEIEEWLLYHDGPLATDDPIRRAELSVPVHYEDHITGIVLMGPKTDGSMYSTEEADFLYRLGLVLGAYIENARILQQLEHTIEERTEELRASESDFRIIVESASDMIYRMDRVGTCTFANPVILTMLGITKEELYGRFFWEFVPKGSRRPVIAFYARQAADSIPETQYELPIITASGDVLWVNQIVKIVETRNGPEYQCIARDITARKKADDARRELEEQKSRFFANISHEIRTPLTLMLSPIESVLQGHYGKSVNREFFNNLHRNGMRLLRLINNLLDFSKIEAGRMTMRVAPVDIVAFARYFAGSVQGAADSRGIALDLDAPQEPLVLHLDTNKLDKVFMNLFSNALKFTGRGGRIGIRIFDDTGECRIEFEDTGPGIPPDKIGIVFDRFSQADTSATRRFEGTGIGLALAREFVEMHGGAIAATSRFIDDHPTDHGTVFTVTLPKGTAHLEGRDGVEFAESDGEERIEDAVIGRGLIAGPESSDPGEPAVTPSIASTDRAPTLAGDAMKTVLVIDDNPDMREYLSQLLNKTYHVHTANDGGAGLDQARAIHPDLIVTDVMMPVLNGFELTDRIRSDDELRSTPIIMLTAGAELVSKITGLERGADDYLVKPFNPIELTARIASLLKGYEYQRILAKRNREIESDLEVARLIMERLLPGDVPTVPGYRSHITYLPMDKVGGDFYDVRFRPEDGTLEVFIADVSGHGLPGAFIALITKMALESIDGGTSVRDVLGAIDEVVRRFMVKSHYVTTFLGHIDTTRNTMRYCRAGHFPPILYRPHEDTFILLQAKGTPLGLQIGIEHEEREIELRPGDRIVLYTDGITECMNSERELFGEERLMECIREHHALPPAAFSERVLDLLRAFSSSEAFQDDLTMIVLDVE
ncbi:MAG TPA: SpoIIE family protein phosphatase [Spirochaetota bacterium]|nr:SpoIIE family protein phosphatase [Spirochaetota bacterium]HNT11008.1 SpoIIE family protein phosphatase [Spirochaetota bacterium]